MVAVSAALTAPSIDYHRCTPALYAPKFIHRTQQAYLRQLLSCLGLVKIRSSVRQRTASRLEPGKHKVCLPPPGTTEATRALTPALKSPRSLAIMEKVDRIESEFQPPMQLVTLVQGVQLVGQFWVVWPQVFEPAKLGVVTLAWG